MSEEAEKPKKKRIIPKYDNKAYGWSKLEDGTYEVVTIGYDAELEKAKILERENVGPIKGRAILLFEKRVIMAKLMPR